MCGITRIPEGLASAWRYDPVETFRYASWLPFPRDVVWRWHEQPEALARLSPPAQKLRLIERQPAKDGTALGVGTRVKIRVSTGVLPATILAEHTDMRPPFAFTDEMLRGPFSLWVHHHYFDASLRSRVYGTVVTDVVQWQLPLAPVSHWVAGWVVRRRLHTMFAWRHDALLRDLTGDEASVPPPDPGLRLAGVAVE